MPWRGFSLRWFLFSFEGRIGRLAYWTYLLSSFVLIWGCLVGGGWVTQAIADKPVSDALFGSPGSVAFTLFAVVASVAYIWSGYAVHAKRWHDRDKSGWWSLIGLVPYIGGMWILIECGFLKGSEGRNRFGGDPRGDTVAAVFE